MTIKTMWDPLQSFKLGSNATELMHGELRLGKAVIRNTVTSSNLICKAGNQLITIIV